MYYYVSLLGIMISLVFLVLLRTPLKKIGSILLVFFQSMFLILLFLYSTTAYHIYHTPHHFYIPPLYTMCMVTFVLSGCASLFLSCKILYDTYRHTMDKPLSVEDIMGIVALNMICILFFQSAKNALQNSFLSDQQLQEIQRDFPVLGVAYRVKSTAFQNQADRRMFQQTHGIKLSSFPSKTKTTHIQQVDPQTFRKGTSHTTSKTNKRTGKKQTHLVTWTPSSTF